MKQPSRYDLLRQAAERLEEAHEAEKRGYRAKAEALQVEAREVLQRWAGHSPSRKE